MSDLELIEVVKAGEYAKAEALLRNGADVNQQGEQGWTPLNFAAGKGDLALVKLLVSKGADVFKSGRDNRTPYMIALAAGRISVARYLREVEDAYPGEKPLREVRPYCKAYHLGEMREYVDWSENRINWKTSSTDGDATRDAPFDDDKIVFLHQDLSVTESIWQNENVILENGGQAWKEFCEQSLRFKVPDDLDLIVPNEPHD